MNKVLLVLLVLCGCSTTSTPSPPHVHEASEGWLKGTLTCLEDGSKLEFRIEKKLAWGGSATGGVAATDPKTGEKFIGTYTGLLANSHGSTQLFTPRGTVYGSVHTTSRNANAIATLTGSAGTQLQLTMEILTAGMLGTPHGIGNGADNHGRNYQVQF